MERTTEVEVTCPCCEHRKVPLHVSEGSTLLATHAVPGTKMQCPASGTHYRARARSRAAREIARALAKEVTP